MSRYGAAAIAAVLALLTLTLAGCSDTDEPKPLANQSSGPQQVTDLNSVSSAPIDALKMNGTAQATLAPNRDAEAVLTEEPKLSHEAGTDHDPAEESLLNDKAAQYAAFSHALLERLYVQMRDLERTDQYSQLKVPEDIKPVVVTAIMDKDGNLKELILEQHSGRANIDKLVIAACKKALWYRNPPVGALSDDGDYKFTIHGEIENFASKDGRHWQFITRIGLGIG
jgi:hypothetical protein